MENAHAQNRRRLFTPAGTKGTPGTTIQSVPYNTLIDDLTADANAPRPVTAGGTGSTSASAARAALGTDNADNITSGTFADARLPTTMGGKSFTGGLTADVVTVKNVSDRVIQLANGGGVLRGRVVHSQVGNSLHLQTYNTSGALVNQFYIGEDGGAIWEGFYCRLGGAANNTEIQLRTNAAGHSYRMLGDNGGNIFIQRSNDRFVANSADLVKWNTSGQATFSQQATFSLGLVLNGANQGVELGAGSANAPFLDFHSGATPVDYDTRIIASGGNGASGNGTLSFTGHMFFDRNIQIGTSIYQSDGNIQFSAGMSGYGAALSNALDARAVVYAGSTRDELNLPIGWSVLVVTSSSIDRNAAVTIYLSGTGQYSLSVSGSPLAGTWRVQGSFGGAGYKATRTG